MLDGLRGPGHGGWEETMGVEYEHYLIPEDNAYKPSPEELSRLVGALLAGGFIAEGSTDTIREMTPEPDPAGCGAGGIYCSVRLRDGKTLWFPCPCSARDIAALGEQDFQLVWSVDGSSESGLKYPLSPFPEFDDVSYDLELHVATDFVYHLSELIDPFDEVACACGRDLRYSEWDEPSEAVPIESDASSGCYVYELSDELPMLPLYDGSRIYRICPACGRPFRPQELVARVKDARSAAVRERAGGVTYLFAVIIDCGKCFSRQVWPIWASEEFLGTVTQALGQRFYEIGDIS
jgi:hypothetical protein